MAKFVAHSSDTDCDGTLFVIRLIRAANLSDAQNKTGDYYYTSKVEPLADFMKTDLWESLPSHDKAYFLKEGYCSIGANWNPWVYDDTIGIPALDSRYDDIEAF